MYDSKASAIGKVEPAVRTLIDSLSQFRSTPASQSSEAVETEVNLFVNSLNGILGQLKNVSLPTSRQLVDPIVQKLSKATDYVQSASQFESGFPDLRVLTLKLVHLRQEVGESFLSTLNARQWASTDSSKEETIAASNIESTEGEGRKLIKRDDDEEDGDYHDPITYELMCDPVKGSDGHTYDRWTIIDHNMTRSPFDQRKHKPFFIACDDLNVRSSLFQRFESSGVVETFHERRRAYRDRAIELAKQRNHDSDADSEVLKMLNHVLEWAPEDRECEELRDAIVENSRPSTRHTSDQSLRLFDDSIREGHAAFPASEPSHLQRQRSFTANYADSERYSLEPGERRSRSPRNDRERPLQGLCGCLFGTCCVCVVMCCLLCMGRVDEERLFYNRRRAREGRFED